MQNKQPELLLWAHRKRKRLWIKEKFENSRLVLKKRTIDPILNKQVISKTKSRNGSARQRGVKWQPMGGDDNWRSPPSQELLLRILSIIGQLLSLG